MTLNSVTSSLSLLLPLALGIFPAFAQMEETRPVEQQLLAEKPAAKPLAGSITPTQPVFWRYSGVSTPTIFTGDFATSFIIESNVTSFSIQIEPSSPSNADIGIYVRRGANPELVAGAIVADYRSAFNQPGPRTLNVSSPTPLPAGDYRIALAVFGPLNVSVSGLMKLTLNTATACTYTLTSPLSAANRISVASGAISSSISVNTGAGCQWNASTNASWIRLTSTTSGAGPGVVQFSVDANAGAQREGVITIGGATVTIVQQSSQTPALRPGARILSHVVSGTGWTSTIYLTNLSTDAVSLESYSIDFYKSDGSRMALPINGGSAVLGVGGTMRAGETVTFATSPEGDLSQGWAAVYGGANVAGFAVFSLSASATSQQEAAVPLVSQSRARQVLLFAVNRTSDTGFAIANPNSTTLRVRVEFQDMGGRSLGSDFIELPPLGHTAISLLAKWAWLYPNEGIMTITGDAPFSLLGLRFSYKGNSFTSFEPFLQSGSVR